MTFPIYQIFNLPLLIVICFIGIAGNGVGLIVLHGDSKRKKRTTYDYLLSLFVTDLLLLIYGFLESKYYNILTGLQLNK